MKNKLIFLSIILFKWKEVNKLFKSYNFKLVNWLLNEHEPTNTHSKKRSKNERKIPKISRGEFYYFHAGHND